MSTLAFGARFPGLCVKEEDRTVQWGCVDQMGDLPLIWDPARTVVGELESDMLSGDAL